MFVNYESIACHLNFGHSIWPLTHKQHASLSALQFSEKRGKQTYENTFQAFVNNIIFKFLSRK